MFIFSELFETTKQMFPEINCADMLINFVIKLNQHC